MLRELYEVFTKVFDKFCNICELREDKMKKLICISCSDLFFRIAISLIPPFTIKFRKIYVDLIGPILAVILLCALLNYGVAFKHFKLEQSPVITVLFYITFMPIGCFILNLLGQSWLSFLEVCSLIGYALYGFILTLLVSFLIMQENNNVIFFVCLIIFGGLSTLRVLLLQLQSIPLPGARLLVCTVFSVIHLLYLVFLHFTFMHPQFMYGKNTNRLVKHS